MKPLSWQHDLPSLDPITPLNHSKPPCRKLSLHNRRLRRDPPPQPFKHQSILPIRTRPLRARQTLRSPGCQHSREIPRPLQHSFPDSNLQNPNPISRSGSHRRSPCSSHIPTTKRGRNSIDSPPRTQHHHPKQPISSLAGRRNRAFIPRPPLPNQYARVPASTSLSTPRPVRFHKSVSGNLVHG